MITLPARIPVTATLLAVVLLLAGCTGVSVANAQEDTEWRGSRGGKQTFSVVVARAPLAWSNLWASIGQDPPAEFDADRQIAVALFLGQRRTGGYGITIGSVARRGAFMVVRFEEVRPAPDAMVSQALTSPYLVRMISKTEFPIAIERADAAEGGLIVPASEARVLEDRLKSLRNELERLRAEE